MSRKPRSECTFLERAFSAALRIARPAYLRRSCTPSELRLDRGADAIGPECMLALQVLADSVSFCGVDVCHDQCAIDRAACIGSRCERKV